MDAKKPQQKASSLVSSYLALYNGANVIGWSIILFLTVKHLITTQGDFSTLYPVIALPLKLTQTSALLEVFHAATGMVKSSPFLVFVQVLSRITIVWLATVPFTLVQESRGVTMYLLPWCISEITRYFFYFCNLVATAPYILVWARYTFFIVLYPLGVSGEVYSLYTALQAYGQNEFFKLDLPNELNFQFKLSYVIIANLLGFIPCFPMLYGHMIAQRKKVLGAPSGSQKKKE